MLLRKASENPTNLHAEKYLAAGIKELEVAIEQAGPISEYPYHVLGTQGMAWAHRAVRNRETRRVFLNRLLETLELGLRHHPASEALLRLRDGLKKDILLTLVADPPAGDVAVANEISH
jgi:hypothetical protein